jgi:glyoxylase-like metal-dependent hydrolase (beta-lactamase superfamily II)
MKRRIRMHKRLLLPFLLLAFFWFRLPAADLRVQREVVGPVKNNCYLLFDRQSKEAALFDVGGPIDSLLSLLGKEHLTLRYIFVTHAHADHAVGIPAVKKLFPGAKVCVSKEEYEDAQLYLQWREKLNPKEVEEMKSLPWAVALNDFDFDRKVHPDIFVKDGDTFLFGGDTLRAFLSPGHSRGSICYAIDTMLFSGDVLFYRTVGRTDLPGGGGWDKLVESVRRLYRIMSEKTIVYPGHGPATDIGSEKRENPRVSEHGAQKK